jgi:hypothetical protein
MLTGPFPRQPFGYALGNYLRVTLRYGRCVRGAFPQNICLSDESQPESRITHPAITVMPFFIRDGMHPAQ